MKRRKRTQIRVMGSNPSLTPEKAWSAVPEQGLFLIDLRWFGQQPDPVQALQAVDDSVCRFSKAMQIGDVQGYGTLQPDGFSMVEIVFPTDKDAMDNLLDVAVEAGQRYESVFQSMLILPGFEKAVTDFYKKFNPTMVEMRTGFRRESPESQQLHDIWPVCDLMYSLISPMVMDSDVFGCFISDMGYMHRYYDGIENVAEPINYGAAENRFRAIRLYMAAQHREMPCTPEFVLAWSGLLYCNGGDMSPQFLQSKTENLLRRCSDESLQMMQDALKTGKRFQLGGALNSLQKDHVAAVQMFHKALELVAVTERSCAVPDRKPAIAPDDAFTDIFSP